LIPAPDLDLEMSILISAAELKEKGTHQDQDHSNLKKTRWGSQQRKESSQMKTAPDLDLELSILILKTCLGSTI